MIRNLKALGLALVAVLAMTSAVASAASAQGRLTSDGPVTLAGTETGAPGTNSFVSFGSQVQCPGSTFAGHKLGTTEAILSGATTATITPSYNQFLCRGFSGGSEFFATVSTNGCDYVFHVGATTGADKYAVTADIVCPAGGKVDIGLFTNISHTTSVCTLTITGQNGLGGASHITSNTAADDLTVSGSFNLVHVERSGLCTLDGKGTTTNTGEWRIDATFTGKNSVGGATGVTVSD